MWWVLIPAASVILPTDHSSPTWPYASDYFNPYGDYISGFDDYLPEVVQTRSMADIVLTLGWRF